MNSQKALLELLFKTQAVHTKTFVRDYFEIQERPEDPFVIHQLLLEYQIKSMVVKFGVEQLREVSFPIITLMANGNIRDFALVHGLEADRLSYSHKAQSVCHETLQEFGSKWTGIAILVDPRNQKPEPGYKRTKAEEKVRDLSSVAKVVFSICFLMLAFYVLFENKPFLSIPLLIMKGLGGCLGILLMMDSLAVQTEFSRWFCQLWNVSGCLKVLNSRYSRLSLFSLGDISLIYSVATSITLLLSAVNKIFWSELLLLSYLTIPVLIYSMVVQWIVVRSWCPMCLALNLILIVEFGLLSQSELDNKIAFNGWSTLVMLGLLAGVVSLVYTVRIEWSKKLRSKGIEKAFRSMRNDNDLLEIGMLNGKVVTDLQILAKLETGNPEGNDELIVVIDPTCMACADLPRQLKDFTESFNCLSVKVLPNLSATSLLVFKATSYMVDYLCSQRRNKLELMIDWFGMKNKDSPSISAWRTAYGEAELTFQEPFIKKWIVENQISHSPCLILNKRIINKHYSITDLRRYLNRKLDS